MYLRKELHCGLLSLKHNSTKNRTKNSVSGMVQDDRLTHNLIMVSTREDCFTRRLG